MDPLSFFLCGGMPPSSRIQKPLGCRQTYYLQHFPLSTQELQGFISPQSYWSLVQHFYWHVENSLPEKGRSINTGWRGKLPPQRNHSAQCFCIVAGNGQKHGQLSKTRGKDKKKQLLRKLSFESENKYNMQGGYLEILSAPALYKSSWRPTHSFWYLSIPIWIIHWDSPHYHLNNAFQTRTTLTLGSPAIHLHSSPSILDHGHLGYCIALPHCPQGFWKRQSKSCSKSLPVCSHLYCRYKAFALCRQFFLRRPIGHPKAPVMTTVGQPKIVCKTRSELKLDIQSFGQNEIQKLLPTFVEKLE